MDGGQNFLQVSENMTKFVTLLDGYPLALRLAAGYITSECACSSSASVQEVDDAITDYLRLYDENPNEFLQLDDDRATSYDHILATVWEITYKRIESFTNNSVGPMAVKILKRMAYLEIEFISLHLLSILQETNFLPNGAIDTSKPSSSSVSSDSTAAARLEAALSPTGRDSNQNMSRDLRRGLLLLEKYSILSFSRMSQDGGLTLASRIEIHRLVQYWAKEKAEKEPIHLVQVAWVTEKYVWIFENLLKVHRALKKLDWPMGTIQVSVDFGVKHGYSMSVDEGHEILRDVYQFLRNQDSEEAAAAILDFDDKQKLLLKQLTAVKMKLIYLRNEVWGLPGDLPVDNSDLFHPADTLYQVTIKELQHWVLDGLQLLDDSDYAVALVGKTAQEFSASGQQFDKDTLNKIVQWVATCQSTQWEYLNRRLLRYYGNVLDEEKVHQLWTGLVVRLENASFTKGAKIRALTAFLLFCMNMDHRPMTVALELLDRSIKAVCAHPDDIDFYCFRALLDFVLDATKVENGGGWVYLNHALWGVDIGDELKVPLGSQDHQQFDYAKQAGTLPTTEAGSPPPGLVGTIINALLVSLSNAEEEHRSGGGAMVYHQNEIHARVSRWATTLMMIPKIRRLLRIREDCLENMTNFIETVQTYVPLKNGLPADDVSKERSERLEKVRSWLDDIKMSLAQSS